MQRREHAAAVSASPYISPSNRNPQVWQPPRSTTPTRTYGDAGRDSTGTWPRGQPPQPLLLGVLRRHTPVHLRPITRKLHVNLLSLYQPAAPSPGAAACPPQQRAPSQASGAGERRPDAYTWQGEPQNHAGRDPYPAQHQYSARAAPVPRIRQASCTPSQKGPPAAHPRGVCCNCSC